MKKIFVLLLSMLLLLSGCSTEKNEASTRYLTTMDTVMTLTAYGPHREQGLDLAQAEIENLNSLLSTGLPGSEISRLNQAGAASFSQEPLALLEQALERILNLTNDAFENDDMHKAAQVEPLEEIIDVMVERLRDQHIRRLKDGVCSIDTGVVFLDVLNNAERISDHCSNIAARLIGMDAGEDYDSHTLKSIMHHNPTKDYMLEYEQCRKEYLVPLEQMEA